MYEATTRSTPTARTGLCSLIEGREETEETSNSSNLKYQSQPERVAQWTTVSEGEEFTVRLKEPSDPMVHISSVEQRQKDVSLMTRKGRSEQSKSTVGGCKTERSDGNSSEIIYSVCLSVCRCALGARKNKSTVCLSLSVSVYLSVAVCLSVHLSAGQSV